MTFSIRALGRAVLPTLLALSIALNVALSQKAMSLHDQLAVKRRVLPVAAEKKQIPPIVGKTLDGKDVRVSFQSAKTGTIIYVFSPSCVWCKRNLANMLELERSTRGRYDFVGVSQSTKDLQDYVSSNHIPFRVIHSVPESVETASGFGATPETLLVTPAGIVSAAWSGSYDGPLQAAIERQFSVKLPGMAN